MTRHSPASRFGDAAEIARVARQARQAEDRRAIVAPRIIAIMQPQTVIRPPISVFIGGHGCVLRFTPPISPHEPSPASISTRSPRSSNWATHSTTRSRPRISRRRACASATIARPKRSAWQDMTMPNGSRISGGSQPLPGSLTQPLALRYHGHQFRVYNPEIGDGRGFLFAQLRDDRGPVDGPRHQGQRPDALEPLRRRPPDAEGRRARGAGDRDARGAGRRDVAQLLADRDRRRAGARRRALPHPLGRAGAA